MKVVAIAGLPSVDLSVPVTWLNHTPSVAVTHEARVFALCYDVVQRSVLNPWLLHADMAPIVQAALRRDLAATFEKLFLRLSKDAPTLIWGDAHAHYLDPLDKPNFVQFFFEMFPEGRFLILLENPIACMEKLLARTWVPTHREAADVTARHIAAAEQAIRNHPDAVCILHAEPGFDNWSEARRLEAWLGADNPDALDQLTRLLSTSTSAQIDDVSPMQVILDERLIYWRAETGA